MEYNPLLNYLAIIGNQIKRGINVGIELTI